MRLLSGSDGAPLDGEQVLAVVVRWADRPLTLEHVPPGCGAQLSEGVSLTWEGAVPIVSLEGDGVTAVRGADGATLSAGRRCALEPGQRLTVQQGALSLEARLQRRAARVQPTRTGESLFVALVAAHVLMIASAFIVALVITPFVDGDSVWGRAQPTRVMSTPVALVPRAAPKQLEPALEAARSASPRPSARTHGSQARDVLRQLLGGVGAGVLGTGGDARAVNDALDRLVAGDATASTGPLSGRGSRGTGPGGGPPGQGFSLGDVGTRPGGPVGASLERKPQDIICRTCAPTVTDDYSRDLVLRVVKRHQSEIRFCYESELARTPELEGKVTVRWSIDGTGTVTDALIAESGLGSERVEACIVSRIKRWQFPEPKAGGDVVITFPWVFRLAGDE